MHGRAHLSIRAAAPDIWLGVKISWAPIGEVHPAVLANYGVKPRVAGRLELRMDVLFAHRGGTARVHSRCPSTRPSPATWRWWRTTPCPRQTSRRASARLPEKLLESLTLFDVLHRRAYGSGQKESGVTVCVLRAADRTLTDEEAENAVKKVLANLAEIGVELRS